MTPSPLWRNRDYLLLWLGQAVSAAGTGVSELAFPLLVLAISRSPADAGFAGALRALPYLLLGLPAGALIDRWDRRRTMLLCDLGRALSLASIPVAVALGRLTITQLYLTALVEGVLVVFFGLAEASSLPRVVPPEQLPAAVAQAEFTEAGTLLLGPAIGGALFSLGRALPFLSYAASLLTLLAIRTPLQGERHRGEQQLRRAIGEGVAWLWRQPFLRAMTLFNVAAALVLPGSTLIVIVLAQREHASATAIGLLFGLASVGGLLGALATSVTRRRLTVGEAILSTRWGIALLWPLYAIAPNPLALGVITFGFAFSDPIEDVAYFSYRHALIPDALKGRVISVCRLGPSSTRPLGLALTGILLQRLGPITTVLVFWVGLIGLALVVTLAPSIRNAPALAEAASP
jgi:MFS family permease